MVSEATAPATSPALNYFVADKYVQALKEFAQAPNQKVFIMPVDMASLAGTLGGIAELAKSVLGEGDGRRSGARRDAGRSAPFRIRPPRRRPARRRPIRRPPGFRRRRVEAEDSPRVRIRSSRPISARSSGSSAASSCARPRRWRPARSSSSSARRRRSSARSPISSRLVLRPSCFCSAPW